MIASLSRLQAKGKERIWSKKVEILCVQWAGMQAVFYLSISKDFEPEMDFLPVHLFEWVRHNFSMYLTVSSRSGAWVYLNCSVAPNNLPFSRLDKSNGDAQIYHFCLRSRIHNFISNLSLPELSDMPSIWLLLLPLHSLDTKCSLDTLQNAVLSWFHCSILSWHPSDLLDFPLLFCGFLSLSSLLYQADLHIIIPSVFPPLTHRSASPFLSQTL